MDEQLKYQLEGDPSVPGRLRSVWIDTTPETNFPPAQDGLTFDVAVLGGGIVGITTALLLKEAGLKVAVIESGRVADGVSGHTTAKITSQHGFIYNHLISSFGLEMARSYADANETAIDWIESTVRKFNIDCDFTRTPAYIFAETRDETEQVRKESEAALRAGLPVSYETELPPLPFENHGAMKFGNQAQFHPRKYLLALVNMIPGGGSAVFEGTRATHIDEGEPCVVTTSNGLIRAKEVVAATHLPFFKTPGLFFTRLYQYRSYLTGMYINGVLPPGVYYTTQAHTFRTAPTPKGTMVIAGGDGHKAGQGGDIIAVYQKLLAYFGSRLPVTEVVYHWSSEDPETPDLVPYVGLASRGTKHIYVATGFRKWGMTQGTVAATLISDSILGRQNRWQELYDPSRIDVPQSAGGLLSEEINSAQHFLGDKLAIQSDISLTDLAPGVGRVGRWNGDLTGIYQDYAGTLHGVKPNCAFEGCRLHWNNAEKTWDCPCCGSRFNYDGTLVMGPASADLKMVQVS